MVHYSAQDNYLNTNRKISEDHAVPCWRKYFSERYPDTVQVTPENACQYLSEKCMGIIYISTGTTNLVKQNRVKACPH